MSFSTLLAQPEGLESALRDSEGAVVHQQDDNGWTLLLFLCSKLEPGNGRQLRCLRLLLDAGAEVNAKNKYGATALMYATKTAFQRR
mmetsp:Transcript_1320/g.5666  ORF Transcript_1320/g.5666 Transcript_1320/m.5666 type:complete len:87 (-) Transcript_1320:12641-12901(-)